MDIARLRRGSYLHLQLYFATLPQQRRAVGYVTPGSRGGELVRAASGILSRVLAEKRGGAKRPWSEILGVRDVPGGFAVQAV